MIKRVYQHFSNLITKHMKRRSDKIEDIVEEAEHRIEEILLHGRPKKELDYANKVVLAPMVEISLQYLTLSLSLTLVCGGSCWDFTLSIDGS